MSDATRIDRMVFLDDSADEIFVTRLLLQRQKVEISLEACTTVDELDALLEGIDTDGTFLLVVDLNLTLCTGTDVIGMLRERTPSLPMIAGICSGSDDPADRFTALGVGSDFYVGKPLDRARLHEIAAQVESLEAREDGERLTLWYSADEEAAR